MSSRALSKIAAATGWPLKYVDVPEATAREGMLATGLSSAQTDSMLRYFSGVRAGKFILRRRP